MHIYRRYAALLAPVLFQTTGAVSLADWYPQSTNLPAACNAVYTTQIANCTLSDFSGTCSASCIDGLLTLNSDILASCSASDASSYTLLAEFLQGRGLSIMCPGVVVLTVIPSPSPTAGTQSSAEAPSSTSASLTSSSPTDSSNTMTSSSPVALPTSTTTIATASSTPTSLSTSTSSSSFSTTTDILSTSSSASTSLAPATSPSSATRSTSPASTTTTAASTVYMPSQAPTSTATYFPGGDAGTGGGSPFDIYAVGAATRHTQAGALALVLAAMLVFAVF